MSNSTEQAEPVKRRVKVLKAEYVPEVECILLLGECQEGKFRQQIHSSSFTFNGKDVSTEMKKLAELMVGKDIYIVFDPSIEDKIKENTPLTY